MLKSLIGSLIAGEMKELTGRAKGALLLYALACVSAVVGVGFLVGAGFVIASSRYGTLNAAIGFGVGFLVMAMLFLAVNSMQAKAWRRRREAQRGDEIKALAATALIAALPGLLKTRSGIAGVLMPIVGLIALKIYDENRGDDDDSNS